MGGKRTYAHRLSDNVWRPARLGQCVFGRCIHGLDVNVRTPMSAPVESNTVMSRPQIVAVDMFRNQVSTPGHARIVEKPSDTVSVCSSSVYEPKIPLQPSVPRS